MNTDFLLIKFTVIISALLIVGVVIYAFNLLPLNNFTKKFVSTIIIVAFGIWLLLSFLPSNFVSIWIGNFIKDIQP